MCSPQPSVLRPGCEVIVCYACQVRGHLESPILFGVACKQTFKKATPDRYLLLIVDQWRIRRNVHFKEGLESLSPVQLHNVQCDVALRDALQDV